jgi:MFS family permease
MLAQQMCGINIIAFYSSTIFVACGFTDVQALYASLGFGAINFLFAFPAIFTIDTFGRRSLLLFTFPNMCWTLLVAGGGTLIGGAINVDGTPTHDPVKLGVVATFIYIFAMFYSPGEGPVPFAYSAEVFPLAQREQGMAWAVTVCLGFAAILTITLFRLLQLIGADGVFFFYSGLNALAFVLILLFVPETKGYTLEELDYVFGVPHKTFINHTMTKAVPYFVQHTVLRRDVPAPTPLITLERSSDHSAHARKVAAGSPDEKA